MTRLPSMDEELTFHGRWWLPGNRDDATFGTLSYVPGESIELELMGQFQEDNGQSEQSLREMCHARSVPVVLGNTQQGKPVTLLSCIVQPKSTGHVEFPLHTVRARQLVHGMHASNPDKLRFENWTIRFNLFDDWLQHTGLREKIIAFVAPRASDKELAEASYKFPTSLSLRVDGQQLEIETSPSFNTGKRNRTHRILWKQKTGLRLIPDDPQPVEWFTNHLWRLRRLFTLLTDEKVYTLGAQGLLRSSGDSEQADLYFSESGSPEAVLDKPHFRMIAPRQALNDFEQTVSRWYQLYDRHSPTLDLFFTAAYDGHLPIRFEFLALAKALSLFAAREFGSTHISETDFERLKDEARQLLPDDSGTEFRADFMRHISAANSTSFPTNLRRLFNSLDTDLLEALEIDDRDDFVDSTTHIRDYIVDHFTGEGGGQRPTGEEILQTSAYLHRILLAVLLDYLDVSGKQIRTALRQNVMIPTFVGL